MCHAGYLPGNLPQLTHCLAVIRAWIRIAISRTKETTTATMSKCAIEECDRPRYVDDWGKIHECCGYTHAMEYQRRQAVMKRELC